MWASRERIGGVGGGARAVDLDVAAGHFGDTDDAGHIIQFAQIAGVELSVSDLPANSAFQVVDKGTGRYEVRLAATMSVNIESLTVTATATCTPAASAFALDRRRLFR